MPRHAPDDFSFLPTVDSTEEEIMELEEQRKATAPWQLEDEPAGVAPADVPAEEPPVVHSPPQSRAAEMEKAVNELLNREVVYEEPPVQDVPPERQDGRTLWKEFLGKGTSETMTTRLRNLAAADAAPPAPPEAKAPGASSEARAETPPDAGKEPAFHPAPRAERQSVDKELPQEAPDAAEQTGSETQRPEVPGHRAERGGRSKRALLETPPVSFRGVASTREKSGRKNETIAEKPAPATGDGIERGGSAEGKDGAETSNAGKDVSAGAAADAKPFVAPKPPPEEELDPDQVKKLRWKRLVEKAGLTTLGWSLGAHLVLLIGAGMWGLNQMAESPVDFLPGGGSAQSQAAEAALTNKIQQKKNPWIKAKPVMRKVTVQSLASDIVLPEMPMDALDLSGITNRMDISKAGSLGSTGGALGMGTGGAGGGFGDGIGKGGKFSFVGQAALGRRVVFVVDVSGSMSAISNGESISRFDLLKKELTKSVSVIPMGTQYQILFFSDFAWPHDQVDSRDVEALTKYRWEIDPDNYKKVKLPTFRFIQATPFSLRETVNIIQRSDNPGGTNWGSGLLMALNASPKPDVIFFMTDGLRSDEMGWIDIVTAENKRRLPMTTIHTSAMQQPDAARELDDLARRNNGTFTVVLGDGKIVKGADFFKMKR